MDRVIITKLEDTSKIENMEDSDSATLSSPTPKARRSKFGLVKRTRFSSCHLVPAKVIDKKSKLSALIDYNILQGKADIQEKMNFYYSAYNSSLNVEKHMKFDSPLGSPSKPIEKRAKKDWKLLANFILKEDKNEFRYAFHQQTIFITVYLIFSLGML